MKKAEISNKNRLKSILEKNLLHKQQSILVSSALKEDKKSNQINRKIIFDDDEQPKEESVPADKSKPSLFSDELKSEKKQCLKIIEEMFHNGKASQSKTYNKQPLKQKFIFLDMEEKRYDPGVEGSERFVHQESEKEETKQMKIKEEKVKRSELAETSLSIKNENQEKKDSSSLLAAAFKEPIQFRFGSLFDEDFPSQHLNGDLNQKQKTNSFAEMSSEQESEETEEEEKNEEEEEMENDSDTLGKFFFSLDDSRLNVSEFHNKEKLRQMTKDWTQLRQKYFESFKMRKKRFRGENYNEDRNKVPKRSRVLHKKRIFHQKKKNFKK